MPKNILDIKNFDGGMNSHTNSRDIEENESALIQNGIVTHKGVIKTAYKKETISSLGTISYDPPDGTALWAYKTDYNKDNNETSSEFLLSGSNRYLKRYGNGWETKIDLSSAAGASNHLFPALVTYDGQLRFCDGSLNVDSNYQPITDAKIYGVFTRKYFNASETTIELGSNVSASITKPDKGQIILSSLGGAINVSQDSSGLRGYLGLKVLKKENLIYSSIDISNSEKDSIDNLNYNDLNQNTTNSDYHSLVGGISFVNDNTNDAMIDTYGQSYSPNDLVFGNASGQNIDGNGFVVTLDAVGEGFYQYITIGSDYSLKNYGSAHARKLTFSIAPATQYKISNNTQSTTGLQTIRSSNVASFIIQYYNNATSAWVDASDNQNFMTSGGTSSVTFNNPSATQFRLKVEMLSVSVSGFEEIRLTIGSASLNIHLRPETGTAMQRLKKLSSNNSSNEGRVEFDDVISTSHLTLENMLSFKIAITNGSGNLTGFKVGINDSSTQTDNIKTFILNSAFIDANKGKGWIEVQAPFSDFIDFNGSPSLVDCIHLKIYLIASSTSAEAELVIDDFKVVKDERGTWDGDYKFFYSWIYDRTQESAFFEFPDQGNGIGLASNRVTIQSFIREVSLGGFSNGSTRITGANVYFAEYNPTTKTLKYDDPFLLINADFEKGVSDPAIDTVQFWKGGSYSHKTHNAIEFIDPPFTTNFSINSGYTYSFNNQIEKIRFRDATVMNRKIYYGNVDIVYEKREGETYPLREKYSDRVYKSLSNRPDVILSYNYIDILINDGDEITALESYADRLLVFKNDSMLLVNATRDVEFLEDNYQHKGVWNYAAIDKVPSGIAWANSFGAYYYDGEKIVELSDKKIDQSEWAISIGSKPTVVYEPKERHLIVASTSSDDGWICDLDTMAWTKLVDFKDSNTTNIVIYDDSLTYGVYTSSLAFSKLVYDKTTGVNSKFSIITRDIDFGSSGTFIDFKKLYVTYKGTATNLTIQYRKNGSISNNSLVGSFSTSLSGLSTVSFIPTDKSIAKNLHSLQFVLNSAQTTLPNNIEIHDMSIVYRGKKVK